MKVNSYRENDNQAQGRHVMHQALLNLKPLYFTFKLHVNFLPSTIVIRQTVDVHGDLVREQVTVLISSKGFICSVFCQSKGKKPLFVQLVLDNIWSLYEAVMKR